MCVANNDARRRHRPAYLAPSRAMTGVRVLQQQPQPPGATSGTEEEQGLAMLQNLEAQQPGGTLAPPTSVPEDENSNLPISANPTLNSYDSSNSSFSTAAGMVWRSLLDFILIVAIAVAGFFFYDVEIKVVQAPHEDDPSQMAAAAAESALGVIRRSTDVHWGGRVVIRNDIPPPLTPPRQHSLRTSRRGVQDGIV